MNPKAEFDSEEMAAMDDLLRCMARIKGWGLRVNASEMIAAVHVLQGFIVQRMLCRVNPDQFGSWYEPEGQS